MVLYFTECRALCKSCDSVTNKQCVEEVCGDCPANSEVFYCVNNCKEEGMCCLPQLPYTSFALAINTCSDMGKTITSPAD